MEVKEQTRPDEPVAFSHEEEMPLAAVSVATSLANKTGSWRYLRPIYDPKKPPCNHACPAGNDIQGFIALILREKFREAWELLRMTNPFPAITGRVCHHPCELECNRRQFDEPLSIRALERLSADACARPLGKGYRESFRKPVIEARPERVAIVGSGPAGLSCAHFLALKGYRVTVFEAEREPGGMLRLGIPEYRLPHDVLDREIFLIKQLGVEIRTGVRVGQEVRLEELGDYQAIFLATGLSKSRELKIPGIEAAGVLHGLDLLKRVNLGEQVELGERVAIVGGGNTAMDAARVALRLGGKLTVIYRRTRAEMPAIPEEIEAAEEEGIEFVFLAAPVEVIAADGKLRGVRLVKMELGEPDGSGRRRPVPVPGSEFELEFDNLLLAIGEQADLSLLPEGTALREGRVDGKVFAGGDVATGAGTVVEAIASGHRAAEAIHRYLKNMPEPPLPEETITLTKDTGTSVPFERINTDYFDHQSRVRGPALAAPERVDNFKEVEWGFTPEEGLKEAERCFSCGVCDQCDNCITYCPDVAISRHGDEYEVSYDYCKGCGICAHECPRWVIDLVEEER